MALEYFLYNTNYGDTIVNRSYTSFSPVNPYEEIYIDYFIPTIPFPVIAHKLIGK